MKRLLKDRSGRLSILLFGLLFGLLLLVFLVVEMGATYQNYEYAEAVLQRAANSAVESNMMDKYRADRVLLLDTAGAESDFRSFVTNDLPISCSKLRIRKTIENTGFFGRGKINQLHNTGFYNIAVLSVFRIGRLNLYKKWCEMSISLFKYRAGFVSIETSH